METRRVGPGSTWTLSYGETCNDFKMFRVWDGGYVATIAGEQWLVVVR